jgi:hypothetical protein
LYLAAQISDPGDSRRDRAISLHKNDLASPGVAIDRPAAFGIRSALWLP